jgi:hypothetical protein
VYEGGDLELVVPGHDLGLDALMQLVHGFSMLAQLPAIQRRDIRLAKIAHGGRSNLSLSFKKGCGSAFI